jgi:hypothetical protein
MRPRYSDRALGVEHDDFRRPLDLEQVGQLIADILQERERKTVLICEPTHRSHAILLVRVDPEESYALRLKRTRKFHQPGRVLIGEGTLDSQKRQNDQLAIADIIQRVGGAPKILEPKSDSGTRFRRRVLPDPSQDDQQSPESCHGRSAFPHRWDRSVCQRIGTPESTNHPTTTVVVDQGPNPKSRHGPRLYRSASAWPLY